MPDQLKRYLLPGWSVVLALIVLLPVLAPGYLLHLDMVFVPRQSLLPWMLGIGGGLPRSVPQDAIVALLAGPLPGQVLQKAVLLASLTLAGWGAGRLAGPGLTRQLPAASLYMWSAYVAARLLMGHWALLWAIGLLPWIVLAARRARERGQWLPVVVVSGAAALVPTGGLIAALTAVPLALGFSSRLRVGARIAVVGLLPLFNAPWWLPALRSASAGVSDPLGLVVFGARADGPGGVLASVLGGGGVWNAAATLPSRGTWFMLLGLLTVLALAAYGLPLMLRQARPEVLWLGVLGVLGVLWAWVSGVAADQGWAQQIVSALPGGGLLRDAQKWTVWWVLLLAICAPTGLRRLMARAEDVLRLFMAAALAILPIAMLPDLAAGAFGRLTPVSYPAAWDGLRQRLAEAPEPGDVISLPWSPFRRYAWNGSDVVLDPLPRYLTRTVVWDDDLPVTVEGRVVQVGGDDPRAHAVGQAIQSGRPLPDALAPLGIKWIVVQRDQPQASRTPDLRGAVRVWEQDRLELWRVEQAVTIVEPRDPVVVGVDVLAALMLIGCGVGWAVRRVPR
ncbi:MAG: hypothetical protein U0R28_02770 [Candidatus Nanopelagicales bacterium]